MKHPPDPLWAYVDKAGHSHSWHGDSLPTLKIAISGSQWCDECGESHERPVYVCKQCGERVDPRYGEATALTKAPESNEIQSTNDYAIYSGSGTLIGRSTVSASSSVMGGLGTVPIRPMPPPPTPPRPDYGGPIKSVKIDARMEGEVDVTSFSSRGIQEKLRGHLRYTLIVNDEVEIPLTDIEVRVAHEASKKGTSGMFEFAAQILVDRGATLTMEFGK